MLWFVLGLVFGGGLAWLILGPAHKDMEYLVRQNIALRTENVNLLRSLDGLLYDRRQFIQEVSRN